MLARVNWLSPVELVGYLASGLVVASLAMTNVGRLRTISLIGSVIFVVYGVLLGSIPIILTTAAVAGLNVWFLRKELGGGRTLGAVPIDAHAPFLQDFLRTHLADIHKSQPGYQSIPADAFALVLTRDGLPAGALLGERRGAELRLTLDYVMEAYRDSRIGRWLYTADGRKVLRDAGFRRVVATPSTSVHRTYLQAMGFVAEGDALVRALD